MKNFINTYRNIVIIVGILLLLFLFKDWFVPKLITVLGGYNNKEVSTDTIYKYKYIKGKIDTLAVFNDYVENNNIKINPKPVVEYVYLDPVKRDVVKDSLKKYTFDITDSLIKGNAYLTNNFKGDALDFSLKYLPLFPKIIKQVDTIYSERVITNTVTLDNKRSKIGAGLGFDSRQFVSISGSYTFKNDFQVIGTFGKSLQNTKEIINGVPFVFTPEDYYGITIIKSW